MISSLFNPVEAAQALRDFDFARVFVEQLGWANPPTSRDAALDIDGAQYRWHRIAVLGAAVAILVKSDGDKLPDSRLRTRIFNDLKRTHHHCLVVFVDKNSARSVWRWQLSLEEGKSTREHYYDAGQPGALFLGKLQQMAVDFQDYDELGRADHLGVLRRIDKALNAERVTKKFYEKYWERFEDLVEAIEGIDEPKDRELYALVLLNRLMFIYFLQYKGFMGDGSSSYLQDKLEEVSDQGGGFYKRFLLTLFRSGFSTLDSMRAPEDAKLLGYVPYLNGGLFARHQLEDKYPALNVPDSAFSHLFGLFKGYSWQLDDTPGGKDDDINPAILGYIFEKFINQKEFGAYYTRPEITEYLCEHTIVQRILDSVEKVHGVRYESMADLLASADKLLCKRLWNGILPELRILDPACGSGAFLLAALKSLISIYKGLAGTIAFFRDPVLLSETIGSNDGKLDYRIRRRIVTKNLYGVDIMPDACEIARLRLFLALVATAEAREELEPLPNIDFNILHGDSLLGLLNVDAAEFNTRSRQMGLFGKLDFLECVAAKRRLISSYRDTTDYADPDSIVRMRNEIETLREKAQLALDAIVYDQMSRAKIKFERATWNEEELEVGTPKKEPLRQEHVSSGQPFHWGFEFHEEMAGEFGGFDVIITNPPWEIFKPNGKEFFQRYSREVTRKKMGVHDFEALKKSLLAERADVRAAWLDYVSSFRHRSEWYRKAPQFPHQSSIVNGKKTGSDINLYKLFTEQCFNLLKKDGLCGIVIPSGIYTDLGSKGLRELLFSQTEITGLFCFENRKAIFDNVHRSFKFIVLTFSKGGSTQEFPAAFMRHEVSELQRFPAVGSLPISVDLIKQLSPDSLSVMEFKSAMDVRIAQKMLRFPLLGQKLEGTWNVSFTREFDMTNDNKLFKPEPGPGRLPLYEGKMIWQFEHLYAKPRFWVDEKEGRAAILGRKQDTGQLLDYQCYRLGYRDISASTNERTLVTSIIPPTFHGNKIPTVEVVGDSGEELLSLPDQLFLCALLNSFIVDAYIRQKVTTTLNYFYMFQLPIPRLDSSDPAARALTQLAARLICTTPEFDQLAQAAGLADHVEGVTIPLERARLRAELDARVAHLYGLTEVEFAHVLSGFPLVAEAEKNAARNAYRDIALEARG